MHKSTRLIAGLAVAAMAVSGCYGPFNLTRQLYRWNGQVSKDHWVVEGVFIVCALPVYSLAGFGDALLFNSIEFWGGKNPIELSRADAAQPVTTRITRGNLELLLSRMGSQLQVEQLQNGQSTGRLLIQRRGEVTVATDAAGQTLFTAQTLPDGSVVVQDATGHQVAYYTGAQVAQVLSSAHQ